jgi:DNA-directed RNA polymerase subunit RPC12/RpoP
MYRQSEVIMIQCRECGYHFFHVWNSTDDTIPLYCTECGSREVILSGERSSGKAEG